MVICDIAIMKLERKVALNEIIPTEKQHKLIKEAEIAASKAYAPHSQFYVGAALMLKNGIIVTGSNQENSSYPSGLCAERVALFKAGADYPDETIVSIAVTASSSRYQVPQILAPCGGCLQVLCESQLRQKTPIEIIIKSEDKVYLAEGVEQFLPFAFKL